MIGKEIFKRKKDEGVSPLISTIIIMTIMTTAITAILYWGNLTVINMESDTAVRTAIKNMRAINGAIQDVTNQGLGATRTVSYEVIGGSLSMRQDQSLWAVSYSTNASDTVRYYGLHPKGFYVENHGKADTIKMFWSDNPPENWWDDGTNVWQYRVPVVVQSGSVSRDYEIVSANVNFRDILDKLGVDMSIDPSSIRVVEYTEGWDSVVGEVPSETSGIDFATTVLNDPWDMENGGDVVQWGGMTNPTFSNGEMSSNTLVSQGWFAPLYDNAEINPSFYTKLVVRMYSSQSADASQGLCVFWQTNTTKFEQTLPIAVQSGWHTYYIDLATAPTVGAGAARDGTICSGITWFESNITRLKIFPIEQSGVNIKVDEIYLCKNSGEVRWLIPEVMPPFSNRYFMIYFDTLDNVPKGYNTSWAIYSSTNDYFTQVEGGLNITFSGNSPVIYSIKKNTENASVEAATSAPERYMSNINNVGLNPASSTSLTPELHVSSMRAQLRFANINLGGGFRADITYEIIRRSPYMYIYYDVWSTSDQATTPPQYIPTFYTARGLQYLFYTDLYGNVTSRMEPGNFYTLFNQRWVQFYGEGESNLILHFLHSSEGADNAFEMATQDKMVIYDEQSPATFSLTWGSDGFQGATSGDESYSGVFSYVIQGGSDAWQPENDDNTGYNYLTFSYKKTNPSDHIYLYYYCDGNWHEITDAGSLDSDYDGWFVPWHSDTNWHTEVIDLSAEITNGNDESPWGKIGPYSLTQGGFMLAMSGSGQVYYDAIYFQDEAHNEENGVHWVIHKTNWAANKHLKRSLCLQVENMGPVTDLAARKWDSLNTPWLPVDIRAGKAEYIPIRMYPITPSPDGRGVVTSITTDMNITGGVTCKVLETNQSYEYLVSVMKVYTINRLEYKVWSTSGAIYVISENGGLYQSKPDKHIVDPPMVTVNMDTNTLSVAMVEFSQADVITVGEGKHTGMIRSVGYSSSTVPKAYNIRLLISCERNTSYYDSLVNIYKTSHVSTYSSTSDTVVNNGTGTEPYRYGVLVKAVDDKTTPIDEGTYAVTIVHTTLKVTLSSTKQ